MKSCVLCSSGLELVWLSFEKQSLIEVKGKVINFIVIQVYDLITHSLRTSRYVYVTF